MNRIKHLFYTLAVFGVLSLGAQAQETSNLQLSFYQDSTHQVSVEQLEAQKFQPITPDFALGFTRDTTWFRVQTDWHPTSGQYFLSVWPPRLERVKLFAVSKDENKLIEIQAVEQNNRTHNVFYDAFKRKIFDLQSVRESDVFYLKVDTDNSLVGVISLLTKENIEVHRANEGFLLGGVAFGLIPFLVIFLVLAIYKKQPIYIVYFFSLLSTTFLYLSIYGFDWIEVVFKFKFAIEHQVGALGIINMAVSYTFLAYICQLLGTPKSLVEKMQTFTLGSLFLLPFYIWLDKQYTLQIFYISFSLLSILNLYCFIRYTNKKSLLQILIAVLFAIVVIGALKVFLTMLGVLHSSENIFISQSLRIVTIPFALLVLVGYFELENNRYILNLTLERTLAEQNKKTELERRKVYESFITMLVHEIKTPLSVIQIAASSLSRHLSENKAETNRINTIKKSVTEINQIFNKCIQVVDLENGSIALEPSDFSLDFLIEDITRTVDDARLQCKFPTKYKMNSDFMLLKTILINLVSNALKYGKEEETVSLDITKTSDEHHTKLTFAVTNVIGDVGPPDSNKLFTRYYRSESAKKHAGSGLGLWLSQELAAILGGRIVLSQQNQHLCFALSLEVSQ